MKIQEELEQELGIAKTRLALVENILDVCNLTNHILDGSLSEQLDGLLALQSRVQYLQQETHHRLQLLSIVAQTIVSALHTIRASTHLAWDNCVLWSADDKCLHLAAGATITGTLRTLAQLNSLEGALRRVGGGAIAPALHCLMRGSVCVRVHTCDTVPVCVCQPCVCDFTTDGASIEATLQTLQDFLKTVRDSLHQPLASLRQAGGTPVAFSHLLCPWLVEHLVTVYLPNALPSSPTTSCSTEHLSALVYSFAQTLRAEMYLADSHVRPLKEFGATVHSRLRAKMTGIFLLRARALISASLDPTRPTVRVGVEVGAVEDDAAVELPLTHSPLQLPACAVSDTMPELVALLHSQLQSAPATASPDCAVTELDVDSSSSHTLGQVADLYVSCVTDLSVSQSALAPAHTAVMHNNSFYLCHQMALLGLLDLQSLSTLRALGYRLLRDAVTRQQAELSGSDHCEGAQLPLARDWLPALRKLCADWSALLPAHVTQLCVHCVTRHLAALVTEFVLARTDISALQADHWSAVCEEAKRALIEAEPSLRETTSWRRFLHVCFILQSDLAAIVARWRYGDMHELMTSQEVCGLTMALFQDTERRAEALRQIDTR